LRAQAGQRIAQRAGEQRRTGAEPRVSGGDRERDQQRPEPGEQRAEPDCARARGGGGLLAALAMLVFVGPHGARM
jgi:hypothetical protein